MAGVNANWYPTRLVERISDTTFRVIRSDSSIFQPGTGRGYITLSHRWGDGNFLKLTTENISALEHGLPITLLRKTFRDALVIAQRMNNCYVWIDSLCIIQSGDDLEDWQQESKTMEQVYSNSFCNISADRGDESNGLFSQRTPAPDVIYSLQIQPESDSVLPWFRRISKSKRDTRRWHILRLLDVFEDATKSPLNHRGWVLQERLLAPRVLHFSSEQVTWECAHHLAWDIAPDWIPTLRYSLPVYASPLLDRYRVVKESMQRLRLSDGSVNAAGLRWKILVATYTSCDLTKHSDRLVAFSGIARQLAPAEGQYVAGLWANSMPRSLLWEVRADAPMTNQSHCQASSEYFAPTFSWAAADRMVSMNLYYPDTPTAASATFIKHRDRPLFSAAAETILTDHVFGPITSPVVEVRMRGILRSCRRIPQQLVPNARRRTRLTHAYACPSSSVDDHATDRCFGLNGTEFEVSYDRTNDEHADANFAVYYYTLITYVADLKRSDSDGYIHTYGLLLKSVDASMARFERVGLLKHLCLRADIRLPLGNERDLPAWGYDEATGEHTFYIV